jgi:hypothetical protein
LPFLVFCCEHLTPQFVWQSDAPRHPNGALTLKEIVLIVKDDHARRRLESICGRPAGVDSSGSDTILLGECRIVFLSEEQFVRRFGAGAAFATRARPMIAAIAIASADLEGARTQLRHGGVPHRMTPEGGIIAVLPDEGVVVEWVAA